MLSLLALTGLILSAEPVAPPPEPDSPRVLQVSGAVFGEVIGRGLGGELGVSVSLWRHVDLGVGLSIGASPGAMLTARFHTAWQPDRWVRPFAQLRARYHPLTQGVGGGLEAGALFELGPGRVTVGVAGELFVPVPNFPVGALMGLLGYEVDLVGTHRAPVEVVQLPVETLPEVVPLTADAGSPALGSVFVRVTDLQGTSLPSRVNLLAEKAGVFELKQSADGPMAELSAAPADCMVEVTAPGFLAQSVPVTLVEGKRLELTLALKPVPAVRSVVMRQNDIALSEPLQFTPKGDLSPASFAILDELVDLLVHSPQVRQVRIEGHTDSFGTADQSLTLTEHQAGAVMRYLIEKGVSPQRLTGEGFGATRPIANESSEAGRRKNRRVEIKILDRAP